MCEDMDQGVLMSEKVREGFPQEVAVWSPLPPGGDGQGRKREQHGSWGPRSGRHRAPRRNGKRGAEAQEEVASWARWVRPCSLL